MHPSFHATGSHGSQGPCSGRGWLHPKTCTQLLLTPPEQHPAPNGLTVPKNASRQPQTNHYYVESQQIPPKRELMKNSMIQSPELSITQAINSPCYRDLFQVLQSYPNFFFLSFIFAIHSKVFKLGQQINRQTNYPLRAFYKSLEVIKTQKEARVSIPALLHISFILQASFLILFEPPWFPSL